MSAFAEREPGLPDQEQEGGGMGQDAGQIVLHVLPIEENVDDIDGTAAFLVSQAVARAIMEEERRQEEIWPDIEDIWPYVDDIWPVDEEAWPDVEEDWYVWNSDQENEIQEEAEEDQDYNNEDEEEDNNDDDYEYEKNGEDEDETRGKKIILHAIEGKGSHG
ncbi:uncharacterized protein LOC121825745 [Peromyscus maniculatus bairdii]|uniref:uncharacterized protein LOC121825745 n=1 Tax=Peromyscus maniculatus bairdii TaxID=230844 RepID=UPI001C2E4240|nr:glutamic acid-rich protein-like [Peromyscus maniculatus bairdii]